MNTQPTLSTPAPSVAGTLGSSVPRRWSGVWHLLTLMRRQKGKPGQDPWQQGPAQERTWRRWAQGGGAEGRGVPASPAAEFPGLTTLRLHPGEIEHRLLKREGLVWVDPGTVLGAWASPMLCGKVPCGPPVPDCPHVPGETVDSISVVAPCGVLGPHSRLPPDRCHQEGHSS